MVVTPADLKLIPNQPGVYLMKNGAGKLIYVGKAVSLRNRVRSYFQASRDRGVRIESMLEQVARVEYITTGSAMEALVLECNLIKQEHPKYNVRLRDDKQYPWVKVTLNEPFPQLYITRKVIPDGSKYYGPYTDVTALRDSMRLLRSIFPLRSCKGELGQRPPGRPCLNFHIQRCLAPCSGQVNPQVYQELIKQVCLFLEGRQDRLLPQLRQEMTTAAAARDYERAAQLRQKIVSLEKILERQAVVAPKAADNDVFGLAQDQTGGLVQVFQVRSGKLVGREYFQIVAGTASPSAEIWEGFLTQYYEGAGFIPHELLLPEEFDGAATIAQWLSQQRGGPVRIKVPKLGKRTDLVKLAAENAQNLLQQERLREQQSRNAISAALSELQQELSLPDLPLRIEGFDVSNIQGQEAVAALVVFGNGLPQGGEYRRFKIHGVTGPNDLAMLQEAVRRRFVKGLEEQQNPTVPGKFARFPNLLLIDGGPGQLNAIVEVLQDLGLGQLPVIGLAKQQEEIFLPGRTEPLRLARSSEGLKLLQRVRDEAHRFAITYHKTLRDKGTVASDLDRIAGIGPRKKKLLLQRFGSVKRIREARLEELLQVAGITEKLAAKIKEEL